MLRWASALIHIICGCVVATSCREIFCIIAVCAPMLLVLTLCTLMFYSLVFCVVAFYVLVKLDWASETDTHKINFQQMERATTDLRPPGERSWRDTSTSTRVVTILISSFLASLFSEKKINIAPTKDDCDTIKCVSLKALVPTSLVLCRFSNWSAFF